MANNYLQFSLAIRLRDSNEAEWWKTHMNLKYDELHKVKGAKEDPSIEFHNMNTDPLASGWSFEHRFTRHLKTGVTDLILEAEEYGHPYHVARLVLAFLEQLRPGGNDTVILTWARTCSRLRPGGEFNGGTYVIKKEGIGHCSCQDQISYCYKNLRHPRTPITEVVEAGTLEEVRDRLLTLHPGVEELTLPDQRNALAIITEHLLGITPPEERYNQLLLLADKLPLCFLPVIRAIARYCPIPEARDTPPTVRCRPGKTTKCEQDDSPCLKANK